MNGRMSEREGESVNESEEIGSKRRREKGWWKKGGRSKCTSKTLIDEEIYEDINENGIKELIKSTTYEKYTTFGDFTDFDRACEFEDIFPQWSSTDSIWNEDWNEDKIEYDENNFWRNDTWDNEGWY